MLITRALSVVMVTLLGLVTFFTGVATAEVVSAEPADLSVEVLPPEVRPVDPRNPGPDYPVGGSHLLYPVHVTNHDASVTATGVRVTVTLPDELSLADASTDGECTQTGQLVECQLTDLAAQAVTAVLLQVDVAKNVFGDVTVAAQVTATSPDPDASNNSGSQTQSFSDRSELSVTQSINGGTPGVVGDDGRVEVYTVVHNSGPVSAYNTEATVSWSEGLSLVEYVDNGERCSLDEVARTLHCVTSSIEPGTGMGLTLHLQVESGFTGAVTTSATALPGPRDSDLADNTVTLTVHGTDPVEPEPEPTPTPTPTAGQPTDPVPVESADLWLWLPEPEVVQDPNGPTTDTPYAGGTLRYSPRVTNNGPSVARDVVVTFTLAPSMSFVGSVNASAPCRSVDESTVTCDFGDLPVEQRTTSFVVYIEPGVIGDQTTTGELTSSTYDPDLSTNLVAQTTPLDQVADLAITTQIKGVNSQRVVAGQPAVIRVSITNHGPAAAAAVQVNYSWSGGISVVESRVGCTSPQPVTCTLSGVIAAGETRTDELLVELSAGYSGPITVSTAVLGGPYDPELANNSAQATITAQSAPKARRPSPGIPRPVRADPALAAAVKSAS